MPAEIALSLLLAVTGIAAGIVLLMQRRVASAVADRKRAEERLQVVLEHAPVAIGVHDSTGTITLLNYSFRKLLGYGPEELRTLGDWWPRAYPDPTYQAEAKAVTQQMIAQSRETCSESGPCELRITCRDGTVKDIELHYIDLGAVGLWTMIDTTDHHRIEEAARLANDHLLSQLVENRNLQKALREQVIRDPLTLLFNRRYLDETLERELARAVREGYPVTVMMLDIDHFKRLNDTYGHLAGDEMLKATARTLEGKARLEDIICRFGGEEFAVILPKMSLATARLRAEAWRSSIAENVVHFGTFNLQATISIGVATFPGDGKTRDELIDAADHALYRAKENGRNCTEFAEASATH